MGNSFKTSANVWVVDSVGTLVTDHANSKTVWVGQIVYIPSAADDDLVFQDTNSEPITTLKAGASDASPIRLPFQGRGKSVLGLKCSTIDGGTAYVYLN